MPLTDDLTRLIGKSEEGDFASLPRSGMNGYSMPSCIYCPLVDFSAEALKPKSVGTVVLEITIDENGRVKDIWVRKALPNGLTEQAIEGVQKFRFKPSTGPDGKPAATRNTFETTFRLY